MRYFILICLFFTITQLYAANETTLCTIGDVVGKYQGLVFINDSVETVFYKDKLFNKLEGSYSVIDKNDLYKGYFTELSLEKNIISGKWNDRYGIGSIKFYLDGNCKTFLGVQIGGYAVIWTGNKKQGIKNITCTSDNISGVYHGTGDDNFIKTIFLKNPLSGKLEGSFAAYDVDEYLYEGLLIDLSLNANVIKGNLVFIIEDVTNKLPFILYFDGKCSNFLGTINDGDVWVGDKFKTLNDQGRPLPQMLRP